MTVDWRFGITEVQTKDMLTLGFPVSSDRFHGRHWSYPAHSETVLFLHSAHRNHAVSRWRLCNYRFAGRIDYCVDPTGQTLATETGWVDFPGLINWLKPIYICGNELTIYNPVGDDVTSEQYAVWYHDVWTSLKATQTDAVIAPYGPVGDAPSKARLLQDWAAYQSMWGEPMPIDFYPLHFYLPKGFSLAAQITAFENLIAFMESHRGADWAGPSNYWLTEYGMDTWSQDVSEEELLSCMDGFTGYLMTNSVGVNRWAWWSAYEAKLINAGVPTTLGERYYQLAAGQGQAYE